MLIPEKLKSSRTRSDLIRPSVNVVLVLHITRRVHTYHNAQTVVIFLPECPRTALHVEDFFNLSMTVTTTLIKSRAVLFFDLTGSLEVWKACSHALLAMREVHQSRSILTSPAWLTHIDVVFDPLSVVQDAKPDNSKPMSLIGASKIL